MGVSELWSILDPVRQCVPLYSLAGKTLAVDLSLWVCEAQHVQGMMGKVTKPHLRNLFFRVSSLTLMGVKLVFVMEGEAPKIKAETMSKRTEMRYGSLKSKSAPKPAAAKNTSRGRFKAVLRECAEMLDCLGVPWLTAAGEAEAMCAFLDSQGAVDGCITNDGDAFLYGAKTVYRNFNMNTKDPQVDCYEMSRVQAELGLNRETLVGLGIFLGCDYIPKGVSGVGKEQTLKLIRNLKGQTLLQKFSEWQTDGAERSEVVVKKVTHCLVCRHPGSAKSHERSGCVFCKSERFCLPQDYDSQCPCDWHQTEQARLTSSLEANIRKKTLACEQFPFTEIINEFLVTKDKLGQPFRRRKPNLLLMQNFALEKMDWPKHYSCEKVLVLMTYTELMNRKHGRDSPPQVQPLRIYKSRVRNGISCFEVIWKKPDDYVFAESCEEQTEVRTVEEECLFSLAYPQMVQDFHRERAEAQENKMKKKKPKAKKEKPAEIHDVVSDLFAQMSLQTAADSGHLHTSQVCLSSGSTQISASDQNPAGDDTVSPLKTHQPQTLRCKDPDPSDSSPSAEIRSQDAPCSPTPAGLLSPAQNSPSVSALIGQLHLSSIDWDSSSFMASPSQPTQCVKADLRPVGNTPELPVAAVCGLNADLESDSSKDPPSLQLADECSLRGRVLMKNVVKSTGLMEEVLHTQKSKTSESTPELNMCSKAATCSSNRSVQPAAQNQAAPLLKQCQKTQLAAHGLSVAGTYGKTSSNPKQNFMEQVRNATKYKEPPPLMDKCKQPTKISNPLRSAVTSERSSSRPEHTSSSENRDGKQKAACKTSVCMNPGQFSDDSDAENQSRSLKQKNKVKATFRPVKPIKTAPTDPHKAKILPSVDKLSVAPSKTPIKELSSVTKSGSIFQVERIENDDSDVSVDSPRPLAERLKMRFAK